MVDSANLQGEKIIQVLMNHFCRSFGPAERTRRTTKGDSHRFSPNGFVVVKPGRGESNFEMFAQKKHRGSEKLWGKAGKPSEHS